MRSNWRAAHVVLLAATVLAMFAAQAAATTVSEVIIDCPPNAQQSALVDPLVHYGVSPTAHEHTPAGALAFSSTSTIPQMLSASTSCVLASDHTMFWFPRPKTPLGANATLTDSTYYLSNVQHTGTDTTISDTAIQGLRFVAPSNGAECAQLSCSTSIFQCTYAGSPTQHTIPTNCTHNGVTSGYSGIVYSLNQCWDGKSLGQGMGGSGAANIVGTNILGSNAASCPAGFIRIPGVALAYTVGPDGVGGYLSSDAARTSCPGCSLHFDWVLGEGTDNVPGTSSTGQATLPLIINRCLNLTAVPLTSPWQACQVYRPGRDLYQWDQATGLWDRYVTH